MTERETVDTSLSDLKIASTIYEFFYNPETVTDATKTDPAGKIEQFLTVN